MGEPRDDDVVPANQLTPEDRAAFRWAASVSHAVGLRAIRRGRQGGTGATRGELRVVRQDWEDAGRPPPELHVHRTRVVLIDGSTVTGVTFVDDEPYARDDEPAFGLYLDERWSSPPWSHRHVAWPDFGVPTDVGELRLALVDLLERARRGEKVELGCWGGHGRTGTALACLAVLAGTPAAEAVRWVREAYCGNAIETSEQERFVAGFTA